MYKNNPQRNMYYLLYKYVFKIECPLTKPSNWLSDLDYIYKVGDAFISALQAL